MWEGHPLQAPSHETSNLTCELSDTSNLDVTCSAFRLFDFIPCSSVNGGSQPMSNWLGGKPVVAFTELLCTKVATASQLLQSVWFAIMSCRYCSTHWFLHLKMPSVWGWNAVDRFWQISSSFMRAQPKCHMKQGSWLLMTFLGSPNHWKMWSRYSFTIWGPVMIVV